MNRVGASGKTEVVLAHRGRDRVGLFGPGVEEVAEEGVGVGGDHSFGQVVGLGQQEQVEGDKPAAVVADHREPVVAQAPHERHQMRGHAGLLEPGRPVTEPVAVAVAG